jgi:hypothetical protein
LEGDVKDNQECRQVAMSQYGATRVTPFFMVGAGGGDCSGYVAWWVRSRLQAKQQDLGELQGKNKSFFQKKYFATDNPTLEDKGVAKAQALQALLGQNAAEAIKAYIELGERADKKKKTDSYKQVGDYSGTIQWGAIGNWDPEEKGSGEGTERIRAVGFNAASMNNEILMLRLFTNEAGIGHCVALDCLSAPKAVYFDPNLCEAEFSSAGLFADWWDICYRTRKKGNSAFTMFEKTFSGDRYTIHVHLDF